jgi:hypothetical protein
MKRALAAHGRLLGLAGSLVVLTFIAAVAYSLTGRRRVVRRVEAAIEPVRGRLPGRSHLFVMAGARVLASAASRAMASPIPSEREIVGSAGSAGGASAAWARGAAASSHASRIRKRLMGAPGSGWDGVQRLGAPPDSGPS